MRRRVDIVIALLVIIIILMVTMMLTSCANMNGLHRQNCVRNITAKWQTYQEREQRAR